MSLALRGELRPSASVQDGKPGNLQRLGGIEPPAMRRRRAPLGIVWQAAAGAGIGRRSIAMRRGQRLRDVGAGAEAGIGEPARFQLVERGLVRRRPLRLDQHRSVPFEAEPAQVLEDAVDELGLAARLVEILDPEAELAAAFSRPGMAERRAIGVSEMQPAAR